MRTTIDIPDETYREIRLMAAEKGATIREILLESFQRMKTAPTQNNVEPKKRMRPVIESTRTDKIDLTNEQIYDIIGFP
jgi:hypothetical protein